MGREYIVWKRLSEDMEMKAFEDDFLTLWIKEENLIVNITFKRCYTSKLILNFFDYESNHFHK